MTRWQEGLSVVFYPRFQITGRRRTLSIVFNHAYFGQLHYYIAAQRGS